MRTTPSLGRALAAALTLGTLSAGPALAADKLEAIRVRAVSTDPAAAFWAQAPAMAVTMLPQNLVVPTSATSSVTSLQVRAVHDGSNLAIRLEWKDKTLSDVLRPDAFGDQVAVELPVVPAENPSPMMGNPQGRVNIWQWRAALQRDLAQGSPEVRALYPNALTDVYPDQVLRSADAAPYNGAVSLKNPVSRPFHSAVLDQVAEGWSTITAVPEPKTDGRGVWKNGSCRVVILHPLGSGDANCPKLVPGLSTQMAFAVWDGGSSEVGGRKAWANWVPFRLAP